MNWKHQQAMDPGKKPTALVISAAKSNSTCFNSHLNACKVVLQTAQLQGFKPDLGFLGIELSSPTKKQIENMTA